VLTDDKSRKLDRAFCIECYSIIFHAVEDILKSVNVGIENEGANWISQAYYDCVSLNGNEANGLDPNIFTQRASLKNIGNVELVKMFAILRGSPFALEIAQEINIDVVGSERTGPSTFASRLAIELAKNPSVRFVETDADVKLSFIQENNSCRATKLVQRLDGIWSKKEQFASGANESIKKTYDKAAAIVWQSQFDRDYSSTFFGQRAGEVIFNGIDMTLDRPVNLHVIRIISELKKRYGKFFVTSSNWHPQKRLNDNIRLFQHLRNSGLAPNSCLFVMGSNIPEDIKSIEGVHATGSVDESVFMYLYQNADWMLHLCYADHCPNVVCEALSTSLPVICSEVGGTRELVRNHGIILKEKEQFKNVPFDYDSPPEIDVAQVTVLPDLDKNAFDKSHIDITTTAKKYFELFEKVLSS
jgi:glycosyltransferase involved in cell wall biosynthesis